MINTKPTSLTRRVGRAIGWRVAKRAMKAVPFVGSAVALGLASNEVRNKGWRRGALHVGLDMIPFVGTAKNVLEIFTGDLIPDKRYDDSRAPYRRR